MAKVRTYFDLSAILDPLEKAERVKLLQAAGYIRTTAQRSMRYGKKPAPAGSPPTAHRGTRRGPLLRKLMRFAFDQAEGSSVAGPLGLGSDSSAPSILEAGGAVSRSVRVRQARQGGGRDAAGRFRKAGSRQSTPRQREALSAAIKRGKVRSAKTVEKTVEVKARPFMAPALKTNVPKIPGVFADSI